MLASCEGLIRNIGIVRPGVDLNPADSSYGERVLTPALRRRQTPEFRACHASHRGRTGRPRQRTST